MFYVILWCSKLDVNQPGSVRRWMWAVYSASLITTFRQNYHSVTAHENNVQYMTASI